MTAKSAIAVVMILVTCGWAAWLFGSVDWASAQRESIALTHSSDTAVLSLSAQAESAEKSIRACLQDADRLAQAHSSGGESSAAPRTRDLFSRRQNSGGSTNTDDLEIINVESPQIAEKLKLMFPADRYKLTGVMLGPEPRAFVRDTIEGKTLALRLNGNLLDGTVASISLNEVVVTGNFGRAVIARSR